MSRHIAPPWAISACMAVYNSKPSECDLAPHRYNEEFNDDYRYLSDDYKTWRNAVPYKAGDVVMVEDRNRRGDRIYVRALILDFFVDSDWRERHGDRMEKYRIVLATSKDTWSKSYKYTWPGMIQRGYGNVQA